MTKRSHSQYGIQSVKLEKRANALVAKMVKALD